ncbi:Fe-S-cluster-containing dehydrogenase component [Halalkaliarchaeum sp. AArc-CO]|uniref:4Fe-4S dicluster domain-containing protein n=1 Tax=unclassified Halalkaliarchaeum TaxID=2678344 RepID=UPI00217E39E5|nr:MULTISPECIES: 4Fe-4S dicluster domain-containing protein [unclassified Halalkaliarchaeum]MDR5672081.1 4Fe-4S dicluster domain-containing protein [Halalkaliarchaeum sp. AArc-GB]UWG51579.1 Fe-S-cluster-containing dehydrogenase component [Halalkaliarchaeum sp. AArc-CO]
MGNQPPEPDEGTVPGDDTSRRSFLKGAAVGVGAAAAGGSAGFLALRNEDTGDVAAAMPASEGYLLIDPEKCAGCQSCMLSCSVGHDGEASLSQSRIQIVESPFKGFPDDIDVNHCRQCTYPACAEACPTDALHADEETGNVRFVDEDKCIGCERCIEACPYDPSRVTWDVNSQTAKKCDLCADTPHWNEEGGPDGSQACVETCPVDAIKFTEQIPAQVGPGAYEINLRDEQWAELGLYAGDAL